MKFVLLLALVSSGQTAAEGARVDSTAISPLGSFRQQVLSALGEQLLQPEPMRTRAFNRYLMKQTGMGGTDVRKGMVALLDSLEAERKGKTEEWERIRTLGGTQVKPKQVDKLLRELTKRTRKVLENNEDETLGSLLQHGAKKADVPDYRARAVLLQALVEDEIVELWKVEMPPVLIMRVPPVYPHDARRLGIEGYVTVTILINRQGKVEEVGRIAGPEIFHEAARAAALQWKFEPAIENNKPVAVWVDLPFKFQIQK